ncbi:MAG: hypothetical protein AAB011_01045, partial [Candidatus Eisenbacteria bacterium]
MMAISELWNHGNDADWKAALDRYWSYVKPRLLALEQRMDKLRLEEIEGMDAAAWRRFLREEYFPWKYTVPNRLATARATFDRWVAMEGMDAL